MGAHGFTHYHAGADLEVALKAAHDEDTYEYGHAPYTGTMSQKGHAVRYSGPVLTQEQAVKIANEMLDDWEGKTRWGQIANDKWGSVVAIPVKTTTREVEVSKISGVLGDSQKILASVVEQARKQRKIRRGEKPESARLRAYSTPRPPTAYRYGAYGYGYSVSRSQTFTDGTAILVLRKGPKAFAEQTEPDGWLFVGTAAS
jgi:hypothetical protein